MTKSNVTKDAQIYPGQVPEPEIIGWLIYRPDTQEFFHSHRSGVGYSSNAYTLEACFAYCFDTEKAAYRYSRNIDRKTDIVPLFDRGDKLVVLFSSEQSTSVLCQG